MFWELNSCQSCASQIPSHWSISLAQYLVLDMTEKAPEHDANLVLLWVDGWGESGAFSCGSR